MVTVTSGGANAWGGDTELRSAATATKPFKVVGVHYVPTEDKFMQVRLSPDSGSTYFKSDQFQKMKDTGTSASAITDFIFNAGVRISASSRAIEANKTVAIWLDIQEI